MRGEKEIKMGKEYADKTIKSICAEIVKNEILEDIEKTK